MAKTNAERQAAYRRRLRAAGYVPGQATVERLQAKVNSLRSRVRQLETSIAAANNDIAQLTRLLALERKRADRAEAVAVRAEGERNREQSQRWQAEALLRLSGMQFDARPRPGSRAERRVRTKG